MTDNIKFTINGDFPSERIGCTHGAYVFNVEKKNAFSVANKGKESLIYIASGTKAGSKMVFGETYDFYYGQVQINIDGNFGNVSVYPYYGNINGKNLITFSDKCPPPPSFTPTPTPTVTPTKLECDVVLKPIVIIPPTQTATPTSTPTPTVTMTPTMTGTYIPLAPRILNHNQVSQSLIVGSDPTEFIVTAKGDNLVYQWYLGTPGDTSSPIVGATTNKYDPSVMPVGNYCYWLRVSNTGGHADSYQMCVYIVSPTPTPTVTQTPTPTVTHTPAVTPSHTPAATPTPTVTPSTVYFPDFVGADAVHMWGNYTGDGNKWEYDSSAISYINQIQTTVPNYVIYANPYVDSRLIAVSNGGVGYPDNQNIIKYNETPYITIPANKRWFITIDARGAASTEQFLVKLYTMTDSYIAQFNIYTLASLGTYFTYLITSYPIDIKLDVTKITSTGADFMVWSGDSLPIGAGYPPGIGQYPQGILQI